MRQAIALPYVEYQNEPSIPLRRLVEVPDNVEERNAMLTALFFEHVIEADPDEPIELIFDDSGDKVNYGDIVISTANDMGVYLYITFLEA